MLPRGIQRGREVKIAAVNGDAQRSVTCKADGGGTCLCHKTKFRARHGEGIPPVPRIYIRLFAVLAEHGDLHAVYHAERETAQAAVLYFRYVEKLDVLINHFANPEKIFPIIIPRAAKKA